MKSKKKAKNPRISKKEKGLIKGALRRVFSRSDLRRSVLDKSVRPGYYDELRPRVKKWSLCAFCNKMTPSYKAQVDHKDPLVPIDSSLDEMVWNDIVDRLWCDESNLQVLCEDCHDNKSKNERKQRRLIKKERSDKNDKSS